MAVVLAAFAVNSEGSRQWAKQNYELVDVSTWYTKSNSKDYAIVLIYNLLLFCCYHCKILYPKQENDLSIYKLNGMSQFSLSFSLSPRG